MSSGFLRLRFVNDGDGTGELIAEAASNGFCGIGQAYFNIEELEKFANSLADYSVVNELRTISGGYFRKDRSRELDQEHLGISIYQINSRGHIGVQIRMATKLLWDERPESQQSAKVELLTTYASLSRFSRGLIALLRGNAEAAVLCSDV